MILLPSGPPTPLVLLYLCLWLPVSGLPHGRRWLLSTGFCASVPSNRKVGTGWRREASTMTWTAPRCWPHRFQGRINSEPHFRQPECPPNTPITVGVTGEKDLGWAGEQGRPQGRASFGPGIHPMVWDRWALLRDGPWGPPFYILCHVVPKYIPQNTKSEMSNTYQKTSVHQCRRTVLLDFLPLGIHSEH